MKDLSSSSNTVLAQSTRLNLPLLLSILGVVISAVANALVAAHQNDSSILRLLHYPTFFLFVLIFCFALFEIVQQGWTALQNQATARSVSISALFGGVLLGPLVLALTINNRDSLRLAGIAVVLSIFSFIVLLVAILQAEPEPQGAEPMPPQPDYTRPVLPPPPLPRPVYSAETVVLPPLFEGDPLYALPQPVKARFFSAVKGNDAPIASEDACVLSTDETRLALCDGASGSSLSRPWAALLAQQWIKDPFYSVDANSLLQWLQEPRQRWFAWVQEIWRPSLDQRNNLTGNRPLAPDRVRRMLEQGAASTFLGIVLSPQTKTLRFASLGDTCFFIFRHDKATSTWKCRLSIPFNSTASFSDRPPLLSSKLEDNVAAALPYFRCEEKPFKNGDILLMATDALAQWLLDQLEQGQTEWFMLLSLPDQRTFAAFVDEQRQNNQLQDDDTTLLVVQL